jgi:hypothetical protein
MRCAPRCEVTVSGSSKQNNGAKHIHPKKYDECSNPKGDQQQSEITPKIDKASVISPIK